MPDDLQHHEQLLMKKLLSHKGLTPSKDFKDDEYSLYLEYASANELERDIVSEETYRKIYPDETTNFSQARLRYYD
jgi:hypothetical protein